MSPGGFAFGTQLPDSFAATQAEGPEAAADAPAAEASRWHAQQLLLLQQQHEGSGFEEEHSLQGSAGQQQGSAGGDGADQSPRRLSGGNWLLGGLGALTKVFKRNATQVGRVAE